MGMEEWTALAGALLVSVALIGSFFRRLPVTTTMFYFLVGMAMGPFGFRLVYIDPVEHAVDVVRAIAAGVGVGGLLGTAVGELVVYLRKRFKEGVGFEEFLALGLIGLSYGVALLMHAYGFLAVFAAGVALRAVERRHSGADHSPEALLATASEEGEREDAVHPRKAPAHMAETVLSFNQQIEHLAEVALVLCLGVMVSPQHLPVAALWFIPALLLVLRPVSVFLGLIGSDSNVRQRLLISWLGIRGIGSFYYLMHVIGFGLSENFSRQLVSLIVLTIAVSIFVHGLSSGPLMSFSSREKREG
ncbi:MAG: cation:proton antiporter [Opitutaceae bacterium]